MKTDLKITNYLIDKCKNITKTTWCNLAMNVGITRDRLNDIKRGRFSMKSYEMRLFVQYYARHNRGVLSNELTALLMGTREV